MYSTCPHNPCSQISPLCHSWFYQPLSWVRLSDFAQFMTPSGSILLPPFVVETRNCSALHNPHTFHAEEQLMPECHCGLLKSIDAFCHFEYQFILGRTSQTHMAPSFFLPSSNSPCRNAPFTSTIWPCQSAIIISISMI
jgi:hypothetical protein